ncbi:hypothetical protein INT45_000307 [Circinella minor]|uniref:Uncharacterized protein n=1 Tax=Circinella minor TaxID=1195481 RepID=A0A8H7S7X2_9FUNG|nr:hypothetical protein INT45_000307 [Circinella minor]
MLTTTKKIIPLTINTIEEVATIITINITLTPPAVAVIKTAITTVSKLLAVALTTTVFARCKKPIFTNVVIRKMAGRKMD